MIGTIKRFWRPAVFALLIIILFTDPYRWEQAVDGVGNRLNNWAYAVGLNGLWKRQEPIPDEGQEANLHRYIDEINREHARK